MSGFERFYNRFSLTEPAPAINLDHIGGNRYKDAGWTGCLGQRSGGTERRRFPRAAPTSSGQPWAMEFSYRDRAADYLPASLSSGREQSPTVPSQYKTKDQSGLWNKTFVFIPILE